jgi:hypothetical protein
MVCCSSSSMIHSSLTPHALTPSPSILVVLTRSLQPNPTTHTHQLKLWSELVLSWARHARVFSVNAESPDAGEVFANKAIGREYEGERRRPSLSCRQSPSSREGKSWWRSRATLETYFSRSAAERARRDRQQQWLPKFRPVACALHPPSRDVPGSFRFEHNVAATY